MSAGEAQGRHASGDVEIGSVLLTVRSGAVKGAPPVACSALSLNEEKRRPREEFEPSKRLPQVAARPVDARHREDVRAVSGKLRGRRSGERIACLRREDCERFRKLRFSNLSAVGHGGYPSWTNREE